ncbi:hypothetical protein GCM10012276_03720 [Nocardioides deserti]|nr:hypothetical protein GCM10012276_03720 [Nocardioides deserti]
MTGAMTRAIAPVAAEIIAGRPPRNEIATAIVNDANSPTRGSTPAMIENEIASGISARATTRPARTSVRSMRGDRSAVRTLGSAGSAEAGTDVEDGEDTDRQPTLPQRKGLHRDDPEEG